MLNQFVNIPDLQPLRQWAKGKDEQLYLQEFDFEQTTVFDWNRLATHVSRHSYFVQSPMPEEELYKSALRSQKII